MIREHDRVVLTGPLAGEGLEETEAVVTVEAALVRPIGAREIAHARNLPSSQSSAAASTSGSCHAELDARRFF